jgi:hypothetical protein
LPTAIHVTRHPGMAGAAHDVGARGATDWWALAVALGLAALIRFGLLGNVPW